MSSDLDYYNECIQGCIDRDRVYCQTNGYDFKERSHESHTIGDLISAVFAVKTPDEAARFYAGYVEWLGNRSETRTGQYTTEQIARANIGWCFGEGMAPGLIAMWSAVCSAAHPVFGTTMPSPTEAFRAGVQAAGEGKG